MTIFLIASIAFFLMCLVRFCRECVTLHDDMITRQIDLTHKIVRLRGRLEVIGQKIPQDEKLPTPPRKRGKR